MCRSYVPLTKEVTKKNIDLLHICKMQILANISRLIIKLKSNMQHLKDLGKMYISGTCNTVPDYWN